MNIYSAIPPAGADFRDVQATALANLPSPPDGIQQMIDGSVQVVYNTITLTPQQVTTFQQAVAATTPNPNSAWNVQATLVSNAQAALVSNLNYINNIAPTVTQAQAAAQILALTKQVDGIIRILLGALSTTAGT